MLKPILTAPMDGKRILLYGDHEDDYGDYFRGYCEGYYLPINGWMTITNCASHPTLWMELPVIAEKM